MRDERLKTRVYESAHLPKRESEYLFHKAFLETAGERFHSIKRAKMDAYMLDHYRIEIRDYDLLAGRFTSDFEIDEEKQAVIQQAQTILKATGYMNGGTQAFTAHRVIDYEKLLRVGIRGILEEIDQCVQALDYADPDAAEKQMVYASMEISLKAVCRFAQRVHGELRRLQEEERHAERKRQLERMADTFSRVPLEGCRHFCEAIQSMWFVQFCLALLGDVTLTGRLDNYLYPYYQKDLETGYITKARAFAYIEDLYYKHNEVYGDWPASIMVGGEDREGKPVWNELSAMCIEAIRTTGLINPSVAVCYTEDMPDDLLDTCVDILAEGYTRPSFFNDRIIQEGLRNAGVSREDARYYIHSTCVEITPIGTSNILVATPYVNLTKAFAYILSEKSSPYVIGLLPDVTPGAGGIVEEAYLAHDVDFSLSQIQTYSDFWDLTKRVMAEIIEAHVRSVCEFSLLRRLYTSSPLASAFLGDCIRLGKDSGAGGARYNFCYPNFPGIINVIDSLAAIKKAVFEEKRLTLKELGRACQSNYEGQEELRQYLENSCAKFGNNLDEADEIGKDVFAFVYEEVHKYKQCLGGQIYPSYFAYIVHGLMGEMTDATPDGRLGGKALSEHLGAFCGMDKRGPVAVMRSIAKVDQRNCIGGVATNYRFSKAFINSERGHAAIRDFIKVFMHNDCFEIQFNVVDRKDLLDAQKNPEKYRTLMVRVAGYSDYFVNLPLNIQNEIIARTENGAV